MSQKRKILTRFNLLRAFSLSFPAFSFALLSFFFFHFCSVPFIHPVVSFLPFFSSMLLGLCSSFFLPSHTPLPFFPIVFFYPLNFLFLFFHSSPFHNFTFILLHSSSPAFHLYSASLALLSLSSSTHFDLFLPFTYFLLPLLKETVA